MDNPNMPTLETPLESDLKNTINMQKTVIAQKEQDIERMKLEIGRARDVMRWFRDNYPYDTREAAVIELLLNIVEGAIEIADYSDIPF